MKNIIRLFISGFTILFFMSNCTDMNREWGGVSFEFINKTNSNIKILNYFIKDTVEINPNTTFLLNEYVGSGIATFGGNVSQNLNRSGKILVVYNNVDTVAHYNDSLVHDKKYLNLLSDKCLYNNKAYVISMRKYETATYTFTQE